MDSLKVSEIFSSVQGEGPSVGRPCTFLRLAGCNLHCEWCDTRYTWDWQRYNYSENVTVMSLRSVVAQLESSERVVVTGGEPLIQASALEALLEQLSPQTQVEVETNGTFAPTPGLWKRVTQWNVSPKLAHAGDPESARINWRVLRSFANNKQAWLKLVVRDRSDAEEGKKLATELAWPKLRVQLMPEARTRQTLRERSRALVPVCSSLGYRLSPRLHLELWDGARGV